jgi:DnaJ-class molecular chaperone
MKPPSINAKPGICVRCKGSGVVRWGWDWVMQTHKHERKCVTCKGKGRQSMKDIVRNSIYASYRSK